MGRIATRKTATKIEVPPASNWRTTDADEINRRRLRAQSESFQIHPQDGRHQIFSTFSVSSGSGRLYTVEIRSVSWKRFACTCVDFRINGLGTCKHIEATLLYLEARYRRQFREAQNGETPFIDIVPDPGGDTLRIESDVTRLPRQWKRLVTPDGRLNGEPEDTLDALRKTHLTNLRISQEVTPWLQARQQLQERKALLREYEQKVQSGEWPSQETRIPLFPYQREGMLHLAFNERALLADEMGLGKTIQAVAACALLRRVGQASRVLVVTPASLKAEWEEQIQRYTDLPFRLVYGPRQRRLACYSSPAFFTIVNYEQVIRDGLDINQRLTPDVVILDEAQRIKNWATKTAQAIKRLRSRYAFVLTGTPIENRIDDLYSLMDFLNPEILEPLFRFNREFYALDDRGRPTGYRNLDRLHARITPLMIRRRKADVEAELPERTERTFFVALSPEQKHRYDDHEAQVARLAGIARRRPLTHQELCEQPDAGPPAPTKLEVIDRATDEALRRLTEAGLIASSTRAIRTLYAADGTGLAASLLSEAEQHEALGHRRQAERKLKMSRLLIGGELREEARDALLEATFLVGKALAVEHRLPVPATLENALQPPLSLYWGEHLSTLQEIASHGAAVPALLPDSLQQMLHARPEVDLNGKIMRSV